jgi:hypothetical protein
LLIATISCHGQKGHGPNNAVALDLKRTRLRFEARIS